MPILANATIEFIIDIASLATLVKNWNNEHLKCQSPFCKIENCCWHWKPSTSWSFCAVGSAILLSVNLFKWSDNCINFLVYATQLGCHTPHKKYTIAAIHIYIYIVYRHMQVCVDVSATLLGHFATMAGLNTKLATCAHIRTVMYRRYARILKHTYMQNTALCSTICTDMKVFACIWLSLPAGEVGESVKWKLS